MVRLAVVLSVLIAGASCSRSSPSAPTPQPACTYALSSTAISAASSGATLNIGVTAGTGCAWTASSNAAFATITSGASGSGNGTVSITVSENAGDTRTAVITVAGQAATITQAASDPLFGNWAGTITKGAGCPAALPASAAWSGIVRRNATGQAEFVISVPSVGVFNQVLPLTLTGNTLQFSILLDAVYTFTATLSSDRRSLTGTFTGGSCSGTWSGSRQ